MNNSYRKIYLIVIKHPKVCTKVEAFSTREKTRTRFSELLDGFWNEDVERKFEKDGRTKRDCLKSGYYDDGAYLMYIATVNVDTGTETEVL